MGAQAQESGAGLGGERLPPGGHVCFIFGDDEERDQVVGRFFAAGCQAQEKLLYVVDDEMPDDVRRRLECFGVTTRRPGQCVFRFTKDLIYPDGLFSAEAVLDRIREFHAAAMREGFAGARGTGDMSWVLDGIPGADRVLDLERRFTDALREIPFTAVCQYDARLFGGEAILEALRAHPYAIAGGRVVKNPYHLPRG
jgi:hypothetical protein